MLDIRIVAALAVLSASRISVAETVLFVKQGATGTGTGTSWVTAIPDLEACLASLETNDSYRINVAAGTYKPRYQSDDVVPDGTPGGIQPSFRIRDGVRIFGGYAGEATAGSPSGLRDPRRFPAASCIAPAHLGGWTKTQVVTRFWIVGFVALVSLKLR